MGTIFEKGLNEAENKQFYLPIPATVCLAYLHKTGAAPDPRCVVLVKASYRNDSNLFLRTSFSSPLVSELCRYILSGRIYHQTTSCTEHERLSNSINRQTIRRKHQVRTSLSVSNTFHRYPDSCSLLAASSYCGVQELPVNAYRPSALTSIVKSVSERDGIKSYPE